VKATAPNRCEAGDLSWTQVLRPSLIGGELVLEADLGAYRRSSHLTVDGVDDADLVSDGRDALRASFDVKLAAHLGVAR